MFNTTFWFLYMIGIAESLRCLATGMLILGTVFGGIVLFLSSMEEDWDFAKSIRRPFTWMFSIALFVVIFMPSQLTFYGGGTQYVVEATELDETMIQLKTVLDQKIAELTGEDND